MHSTIRLACVAVVSALIAAPTNAATFCVDTAAEIQTALGAAQSNDEDDLIKVVGGTYSLPFGFFFSSFQPHAITIRGGYSANCANSGGATTTLDGHHDVQSLTVSNHNGAIGIDHLTFVNGEAGAYDGGGLAIQTSVGDIRVDRCTFIGNRSDASGGGLGIFASGGDVRVRNNLAFANSASNGGGMSIVLTDDGDANLVGNTVVANLADSDTATAGLSIGGDAYFFLSNNILWNNNPGASPGGVDFGAVVPTAQHSRIHNDIGTINAGTVGDFVVAELDVDPQFLPCAGFLCFSFELAPSSPLVDAGIDEPPGGMTALDLADVERVIGAHVDIGAYENERLFVDGFDE